MSATAGFWAFGLDSDARWLADEAVPALEAFIEAGDLEAAYVLAQEAQRRVPGNARLAEIWREFTAEYSIPSEPPGARVYRRPYDSANDAWQALGTTPIDTVRLPYGLSRLRFELEGYEPLFRTLLGPLPILTGRRELEVTQDAGRSRFTGQPKPFKLDTPATLPEGKVRVPGWQTIIGGTTVDLEDFFLGRHEVTNSEYKAFVTEGGYAERRYWLFPITRNGVEIPWEAAMADFTDRTGRPGPSTWVGGDYPSGQDHYPVGGLSWYEAAAYAEFVGEELPTVHHWVRATDTWDQAWVMPASNMQSDGPRPVGEGQAMSWSGALDMGGNVREWVFNAVEDQRYILGGGWNDQLYIGGVYTFAQPALDRSATNGLRLAVTQDPPNVIERARQSQVPEHRDLTQVEPVSDEVFEVYARLHGYEPGALDAVVESREEARDWVLERISFNAAYGDERMGLNLFLPRNQAGPLQTVVLSPGADVWAALSLEHAIFQSDFIVKNGRALAWPAYKGSLERGDELRDARGRWFSAAGREREIQIHQDLRRTLDYLETRRDIDADAFAYYGVSMGGQRAPANLALEPRFKVAVLVVGGVNPEFEFLPEIDPMHFLPRVTTPTLMLNGELDNIVPLEAAARPFFERLGTPAADKRQVVQPGGHFVPEDVLIRETLDWLDRYLGAPVTGS